jgi:hypothetical protein
LAETKKNWKDSNWYVSITSFWSEYRKHRIGIVGISLIAIFVGMAIFAPFLVTHSPIPQDGVAPQYLAPSWLAVFDSTAVVTNEYLDDPYLTSAPFMAANGTSTEFSWLHQPIDDLHNESYVNLTWTHTAGTKLSYNGVDPDKIYPDYNDFVYFDQIVTWPWNGKPSDVNMSISFATERTGDFAPGAQTLNNLMFRIYVWVIDSSGEWTRIYESRDATYTDVVREKTNQLELLEYRINFWWNGFLERNPSRRSK